MSSPETSPETTAALGDSARTSEIERAKSVATILQPVIIVASLLLFAFVRIGEDAFFRPFGTTAEEAGIGYSTTIAQTAVGIAISFLLLCALAACGSLYVFIRSDPIGQISFKRTAWMFIILSLLIAAWTVFIVKVQAFHSHRIPMGQWLSLLLVVVVIGVFSPRFPSWRTDRTVQLLVAGLAALLISTIGISAYMNGLIKGKDASRGSIVRATILSPLPVNTACVRLSWLDQKPHGLSNEGGFLRIGSADGIALLYGATGADPGRHLYRVPESAVTQKALEGDVCPVATATSR
jgi:hypothetical protein